MKLYDVQVLQNATSVIATGVTKCHGAKRH